MKAREVFSVTVLLFLVFSAVSEARMPISQIPAARPITGEEPELLLPHPVTNGRAPGSSLDEPIGEVYVVGVTWFDLQHNGSAGKMIGVDSAGYVHLVWTRGMDSGNIERHVFYNAWDPLTQAMLFDGGAQIDVATRAGFISQAVIPTGWAFPGFHEIPPGLSVPHAAGGMDFMPHIGAFTVTEPAYLNDMQLVWPKIAAGPDNVLHMVSTVNAIPYDVYYSRGIPDFESSGMIVWEDVSPGQQFMLMGTGQYVSADIAASQVSNRLAIAWTDYRPGGTGGFNQDVFYRTSDDGGLNWNNLANLTNFAVQDTHRAYADVSVVFDNNDNLHVAFSTSYYDESSGVGSSQSGRIWHWSEAEDSINAVADNWVEGPGLPGNYRRNVDRPSLSIDTTTGYIYCAYERYNTASWSSSLYYNADACVSVSTDQGLHWSVGRNVTDTTPQQNPSPAGSCMSEREITLADPVHFENGIGYLNLQWERDLDCGSAVQGEGTYTLDTMYYQRIPVDSIPTTPLMPHFAFRFGEEVDPERRCCYGDSTQPDCANLTFDACTTLGGDWSGNLTCSTPCPVVIVCTCQGEPNTHCNLNGGAIPDGNGNGINVVIDVPVAYHITDLNVCLDVTHPSVSDLVISLRSPDNTQVGLYTFGATGANLSCTTFDDEAPGPIGQGMPPYNDSFQPLFPLNGFDGEVATGNWILNIADIFAGSTGTLNWVCLNFTYDYIVSAQEIEPIPVEYSLAAYPNPFNPSTSLRFGVEKAGRVTVEVFNVAGQRVSVLTDREYAAGYHTVEFDARELPTGIYLAQIRAGEFVKTEKMVLLK